MLALELDHEQQESLQRSMAIVRNMSDEERLALIEHAVTAAIHYARNHKDQVLTDWAAGLLGTLRLHASDTFRKAIAAMPRAGRRRHVWH
jgi:hypothetical protein